MTDKEQIIIDGVDVSGCKYYLRNTHKSCGVGLVDCEGKDCIFKQLARKTQLSIKQSKELIRLRKELQESTVKNRNLKQECEELKSKNSILKNSLKPFQDEYFKNLETIVIAGLAKKSIRITAENTQLRKALEEIEGIAKNFGSYAAWQEQRINKILDIIYKAKGEE